MMVEVLSVTSGSVANVSLLQLSVLVGSCSSHCPVATEQVLLACIADVFFLLSGVQ
jgi:hypothetical protein